MQIKQKSEFEIAILISKYKLYFLKQIESS